jgi:hypothetical protein
VLFLDVFGGPLQRLQPLLEVELLDARLIGGDLVGGAAIGAAQRGRPGRERKLRPAGDAGESLDEVCQIANPKTLVETQENARRSGLFTSKQAPPPAGLFVFRRERKLARPYRLSHYYTKLFHHFQQGDRCK